MSRHEHLFACHTRWTGAQKGPTSSYRAYDRTYEIAIEGKPTLVGSSAPVFLGDGALHNPEDLLVAALSACHMLSYLALCARERLAVVSYEDRATGEMRDVSGVTRFTLVTLRPLVVVAKGADVARAVALHAAAHAECYLANSVNFPVENEPAVSEA